MKRPWIFGGIIATTAIAAVASVMILTRSNLETGRLFFELPDSKGVTHRLSDLGTSAVLVHFWATWCPPCVGELPEIVDFATAYKDRPLKIVLISLDESWADAKKMLKEDVLPSNVISLIDLKKTTPDAYGSFQYPETYLLDSKREVVFKWVGPQDWKSSSNRGLIEKYLPAVR